MIRAARPVLLFAIAASIVAGCAANLETTLNCASEPAAGTLLQESVRVLSLNTAHGRRDAANQLLVSKQSTYDNLDSIAELMTRVDADIVALQEADGPSRWSGSFDHVEYLRDKSRQNCSFLGHHADTWLYSFGSAILARTVFTETHSGRFAASPPTTTKGFVRAKLDWDTGGRRLPLTIVSLHLDFLRNRTRDAQIAALIDDLETLDTPLIVAGDFNSEWADERSQVRQLADSLQLTVFEPGAGDLGTYHGTDGKRLDWILISRDLKFVEYRVLTDKVSDHLAVYAAIGIDGEQQ